MQVYIPLYTPLQHLLLQLVVRVVGIELDFLRLQIFTLDKVRQNTLAMSSATSLSSSCERAAETRPRAKFLPRTEILFPNAAEAEGTPRRRADVSITSSCSSEAVCIILRFGHSTIWARRNCVGSTVFASVGTFGDYCGGGRVGLGCR